MSHARTAELLAVAIQIRAVRLDAGKANERPVNRARLHATAPKSRPAAAVTAMASAPQKVTRHIPAETLAPPARAAANPSAARKASDVAEIHGIRP